ncbi:MAG: ribonuclease H family protein [Lactobacillus sp.]|jgi:ribonuclease HI|nr:ribonuclease H family protein [Lactobacillus sp.]MCH3905734.1 ribonuclease H family protein [Lactobacillus sp.]MCH3990697.1 ribonuclease H family protein [Lactobacillus sp.]MCH4068587.1 ribonuclease H family protein [Lactobacillus sp.]MCI1304118.1 ribonuclease H family protein [Lactobacillus sp.]
MKLYAVKRGRIPGVYRTWDAAEKQVKGFAGAEYKSFDKVTDAAAYMNWNEETKPIKPSAPAAGLAKPKPAATSGYTAKIFTDGGSRNHGVYAGGHVQATDKAAWAYLIQYQGQEIWQAGGEFGATNNKMEQKALIEALKKLIELGLNHEPLLFTLDSQYVLNAINKGWLQSWEKRGWRRSNGPLKNTDQWQEMASLLKQFTRAEFTWTKGHEGNYGNEFVDHALNRYMDQMH